LQLNAVNAVQDTVQAEFKRARLRVDSGQFFEEVGRFFEEVGRFFEEVGRFFEESDRGGGPLLGA
jgi:hypothetical protein